MDSPDTTIMLIPFPVLCSPFFLWLGEIHSKEFPFQSIRLWTKTKFSVDTWNCILLEQAHGKRRNRMVWRAEGSGWALKWHSARKLQANKRWHTMTHLSTASQLPPPLPQHSNSPKAHLLFRNPLMFNGGGLPILVLTHSSNRRIFAYPSPCSRYASWRHLRILMRPKFR